MRQVMVTVATQLDVPIKILVPLFLSAQGSEWHFTLIGLVRLPAFCFPRCFVSRSEGWGPRLGAYGLLGSHAQSVL